MFIKKISIKNFHVFQDFQIDDINTPDEKTEGSGLTVLVGENGHGKSTLLEALALPLLPLRAKNKLWDRCRNFSTMGNVRIEISSGDESEHVEVSVISGRQKTKTVNGPAPEPATPNGKIISRINDDTEYRVESSSLNMHLEDTFVLFLDTDRNFRFYLGDDKTDARDYFIDRMNDSYFRKEGYNIINHDAGRKAVSEAMKEFEEISLWVTEINFNSFFAFDKDTYTTNSYSNLGSGYQAIFHFLYFFYLAQQNRSHFVALIDEPELHMHPALQAEFVKFLLKFSKNGQIVIATHSPLVVKQILNEHPFDDEKKASKITHLGRDDSGMPIAERVTSENFVLPYTSANEVNYVAFNLATEEYHNELHEGLMARWKEKHNSPRSGIKEFDKEYFIKVKGEPLISPWMGDPNQVSVHTFIRNQIHHREENGQAEYGALKASIDKMRQFWQQDYPAKK